MLFARDVSSSIGLQEKQPSSIRIISPIPDWAACPRREMAGSGSPLQLGPNPYFSQLGRRGMKFVQVGELQDSLAGCCCVAVGFSLRESFFLERAVSGAHLALR